jgi:hypothetical protein
MHPADDGESDSFSEDKYNGEKEVSIQQGRIIHPERQRPPFILGGWRRRRRDQPAKSPRRRATRRRHA